MITVPGMSTYLPVHFLLASKIFFCICLLYAYVYVKFYLEGREHSLFKYFSHFHKTSGATAASAKSTSDRQSATAFLLMRSSLLLPPTSNRIVPQASPIASFSFLQTLHRLKYCSLVQVPVCCRLSCCLCLLGILSFCHLCSGRVCSLVRSDRALAVLVALSGSALQALDISVKRRLDLIPRAPVSC